MNNIRFFLISLLVLSLSACENIYLPSSEEGDDARGNVVLSVNSFEQIPFSSLKSPSARAETPITELTSRLNFAVFKGDEKVKNVSQKNDDEDFGTVTLNLSSGNYEVVVIAHSSSGSATISKPTEISFPNNRLSDIYYYYGTLTVTEEKEVHRIDMKRAVAMFRLVLRDTSLPGNFSQMQFYYTGGSSTLDATTGHGSKQSRQREIIYRENATEDKDGNLAFEVYTFPHTEGEDKLKMTVTAQDASGTSIAERIFVDVPVVRNRITQYAGKFFQEGGGTGGGTSSDVVITANPEWDEQKNYVF